VGQPTVSSNLTASATKYRDSSQGAPRYIIDFMNLKPLLKTSAWCVLLVCLFAGFFIFRDYQKGIPVPWEMIAIGIPVLIIFTPLGLLLRSHILLEETFPNTPVLVSLCYICAIALVVIGLLMFIPIFFGRA
jgi:hypothetical protein